MDFSHDRMVFDHSIVVSLRSGKSDVSMLNFAIDTPISWSIPTLSTLQDSFIGVRITSHRRFSRLDHSHCLKVLVHTNYILREI